MNQNPETSETIAAPAEPKSCTRHGITIVKRSNKPDAKYTCRIKFQKKVHPITLAETAKESFDIAIAARREIQGGRWAELKAKTGLRQIHQNTLSQIFAVYRQFKGTDRPADNTRELNIHALTAIVRETLGEGTDINTLSLGRLTGDLVWQWKEKKRKLADEANDDERERQILRSANSRLRQARSIFSDNDDLRTFYRNAHTLFTELELVKIELPETIAKFRSEPGFTDCSKDEYHAPSDAIIAETFKALDKLALSQSPDDLNMFKACWLAIGFGLRRSEISRAQNNWFEEVDGVVFIRGDQLSKNKKFPEVRVQLDAWERLAPHIKGGAADAFVLHGSDTERKDTAFRRISEWMRSMGWETTHHVHEFRAWAGCQIAMAQGGRGLLDAQVFMRHGHFSTTEKYYGHHLKIKLDAVKLSIPTIAKKEFKPVVLPNAGTA